MQRTSVQPLYLALHPKWTLETPKGTAPQAVESLEDAIVPIIFPKSTLITTDDHVEIIATEYRFKKKLEAKMSPDDAKTIERQSRHRSDQPVTLRDGSVVVPRWSTTNPYPTWWLQQTDGEEHELLRVSNRNIQYRVDNQAQEWHAYDKPFRLPAGRWSVVAEASSPGGQFARSSSKVFTVEYKAAEA